MIRSGAARRAATVRSRSTRSSLACTGAGSFADPVEEHRAPAALSKTPARDAEAPVNAPFSWPNSSDSTSPSGIAAEFTATKGPSARRERAWIARAATSLPVPLSPVISTVVSRGATARISLTASAIAGPVTM